MTWLIMGFVVIAGAAAQVVCPPLAWLGQSKPPLLLAVVLYYALCRDTGVSLVAALTAGVLHDAMSPIPLGYSAFCFCLAAWAAGRMRELVMCDSAVTQVFFGGVAALSVTVLLYVLLSRADLLSVSAVRLLSRASGQALLGAILTPPVFLLVGRLDRLVGNVVIREPIDGFE